MVMQVIKIVTYSILLSVGNVSDEVLEYNGHMGTGLQGIRDLLIVYQVNSKHVSMPEVVKVIGEVDITGDHDNGGRGIIGVGKTS